MYFKSLTRAHIQPITIPYVHTIPNPYVLTTPQGPVPAEVEGRREQLWSSRQKEWVLVLDSRSRVLLFFLPSFIIRLTLSLITLPSYIAPSPLSPFKYPSLDLIYNFFASQKFDKIKKMENNAANKKHQAKVTADTVSCHSNVTLYPNLSSAVFCWNHILIEYWDCTYVRPCFRKYC